MKPDHYPILNGVTFAEGGAIVELDMPHPGSDLFSLAPGGAVYLRDPRGLVDDSQLNGGRFAPVTAADWGLIEPNLWGNEALFGIPVERLLTVGSERLSPDRVYRKVEVRPLGVLH